MVIGGRKENVVSYRCDSLSFFSLSIVPKGFAAEELPTLAFLLSTVARQKQRGRENMGDEGGWKEALLLWSV
jgi:hypothetical protein